MRKVTFAINNTLDGFADHTAGIADDELHEFFTNYLKNIDIVLLGRKTYEMMTSYWPHAREDPRSTKSEIEFADEFNSIAKVVFSNTLKEVNWENSVLADKNLPELVTELKNQSGKNISAGSLSIASQLLKLNLIDEFWFVVHPIILGKGKQLFENLDEKNYLKLVDTKKFNSGAVVLHYQKP
jgi:dihydrofolate reductase